MLKKKSHLEVVEELLETINNNNLERNELIEVLSSFLFSVGASIEGVADKDLSAEEVLKAYGSKPTLGTALMAQALYMVETWTTEVKESTKQKEKPDGRKKRNSRKK
jgi:hypothetical protein